MFRCVVPLLLVGLECQAGGLDFPGLQRGLDEIAGTVDGRMGVCVSNGTRNACLRGSERFSMQSVMKLLVGTATLAAVDAGTLKLEDKVTLHREDLSLFVQPISMLVGPGGYSTSVGDLIRRAIIDSDSAATDFLIRKLGGPRAIQRALTRKGIRGLRLDRDERHLQTEIHGLHWRPGYVDAKVLEAAIAAVPNATKRRAYRAYQRDVRDTSTPQAMATFLVRLYNGELLTPSSTSFVLQAMADCATFPDRLKAGVPGDWRVSHKTGTSGAFNGITAATNDVGIFAAPDGSRFAVVVFVADSSASAKDRAAAIAAVARVVVKNYRR